MGSTFFHTNLHTVRIVLLYIVGSYIHEANFVLMCVATKQTMRPSRSFATQINVNTHMGDVEADHTKLFALGTLTYVQK